MATILDAWRPGDLLIEALRIIGSVLIVGGIVMVLLGLLSGSPEPHETRFDLGMIEQGGQYALAGAALRVGSWALRLLLGRR